MYGSTNIFIKNLGLSIVGGLRPKTGDDLAPGTRSKDNLAPIHLYICIKKECELANSSKDTKQPLKSQRLFLCYMCQSKKIITKKI